MAASLQFGDISRELVLKAGTWMRNNNYYLRHVDIMKKYNKKFQWQSSLLERRSINALYFITRQKLSPSSFVVLRSFLHLVFKQNGGSKQRVHALAVGGIRKAP